MSTYATVNFSLLEHVRAGTAFVVKTETIAMTTIKKT